MKANARQALLIYPGQSKKVSLVMEVEQTYVIKLFVEEGMKGMETVDRMSKRYGRGALQRTQACDWTKEVKSGRKGPSSIPSRGRAPNGGLDDCIGKALKEPPHLSTRKITNRLNISSTTVRHHLTKSLGMKCYHM
jgi:hypothetical protein